MNAKHSPPVRGIAKKDAAPSAPSDVEVQLTSFMGKFEPVNLS